MPYPTFEPVVMPSPGSTKTPQIALNKSQFGDGYIQASPKGINHIRNSVSLKWNALTISEAASIEAFLRERGGYKPFYYSIYPDPTLRKWTCSEWSVSSSSPIEVTATFMESFIPD